APRSVPARSSSATRKNQTQDVAALNRDLDRAQEITKNERSGVEFYVSDTAVREAIKAVEFVGKTLAEISTGVFGELGRQGNATFSDLAAAKERGALSDADIVAQLGACNPSQGFNLFDLFIGTAHAAGTCQVKTADGQTITFSGDDRQKCLEAYMAMMAARPDTIQQIIGGLTLLNGFAGPLGNHAAIYGDGPVIIGTDENGGNFGAVDESGRLLYQNRLTGEYFFANPNDPRDQKVIDTAFDIAGIIAGASAASKVRFSTAPSAQIPGAAQDTATRFLARADGAILDTSKIAIPGPNNSPFGKIDYLLGKVAYSQDSLGKGGYFKDYLGFAGDDLGVALTNQLKDNFGSASVRGSKIEVSSEITGPNGVTAGVKSVWQVRSNGSIELITALPARR
ncbi:hypothetical protein, partial [Chelatococcus sp. GW1]|uniref:hypothetical protein n=1 Tax=Chelatococcus sp. GW1 TaxID=1211115 RepID=UPI00058E5156